MDSEFLLDGFSPGGSGGGGMLATMLVVVVLLGALVWLYLHRDENTPPPTVGGSETTPTLTLFQGAVTHESVTVGLTLVMGDADFQSYDLRYRPTGGLWVPVGESFDDPTKPDHQFEGLQPNTPYEFHVTAHFSDKPTVSKSIQVTTDAYPALQEDIDTLDQGLEVESQTPEGGTVLETYPVLEVESQTPEEETVVTLASILSVESVVAVHVSALVGWRVSEDVQVQVQITLGQSTPWVTLPLGQTMHRFDNLLSDHEYSFTIRRIGSEQTADDWGDNHVVSSFQTNAEPSVTIGVRDITHQSVTVSWGITNPFDVILVPRIRITCRLRISHFDFLNHDEFVVDVGAEPQVVRGLLAEGDYSFQVTYFTTEKILTEVQSAWHNVTTYSAPQCEISQLTCSESGSVVKIDERTRCTVPAGSSCHCNKTGQESQQTASLFISNDVYASVQSSFCACTPPIELESKCLVDPRDGITYTGSVSETWEADTNDPRARCFTSSGQYYDKMRSGWTSYQTNDSDRCPRPTDCEFQTDGRTGCMYANVQSDGVIRNFATVNQKLEVSGFEPAANGGMCSAVAGDVRGGRMGTAALTHKYKLRQDILEVPLFSGYCASEAQDHEGFYTLVPREPLASCDQPGFPQLSDNLYMYDCSDVREWDRNLCVDMISRKVNWVDPDGRETEYTAFRQGTMGIHLKMPSPAQDDTVHCITPPDGQGVSTLRVKAADESCEEWMSPSVECSRDLEEGLCYDKQGLVRDAGDGFNAYFHRSATHGMIPFDNGTVKWTNHDTCPERLDCYYDVEAAPYEGDDNCVPGMKARRYRVVNFSQAAQGMGGLPVGNACVSVPNMGMTTLGPNNVPNANGTFLAADDTCRGAAFDKRVTRYTRTYLTGLTGKEDSRPSAMLGPLQYQDENKHFITPSAGIDDPTPAICESKCDAEPDCGGFAASRFFWPNSTPGVACRFFRASENRPLDTVPDAGVTLYTKTNEITIREEPTCSTTMRFVDSDREDAELFHGVWPSFYSEWDHDESVESGTSVIQHSEFDYTAATRLRPSKPNHFSGSYTWSVKSKPGYTCEYAPLHNTFQHEDATWTDGQWPTSTVDRKISLQSTQTAVPESPEPGAGSPEPVQINGMFRLTLFDANRQKLLHYDWSVTGERFHILYHSLNNTSDLEELFTIPRGDRLSLNRPEDLAIPPDLVYDAEKVQRDTNGTFTLYYTLVSAHPRYRPSGSFSIPVRKLSDQWAKHNLWKGLTATVEQKPLVFNLQSDRFIEIDNTYYNRVDFTFTVDAYDIYLDNNSAGRFINFFTAEGFPHSKIISVKSAYLSRHCSEACLKRARSKPIGPLEYEDAMEFIDEMEPTGLSSLYTLTTIQRMVATRADWYIGA